MVGVLFGRWSVVDFPLVGGEFLVWSVVFMVCAGGGQWSVVGVLHFYWSVVCFYF